MLTSPTSISRPFRPSKPPWALACDERFEISGGYELTNWFDVADRSMFVDSVHEGAYSPSSMNLLLEGFFLRGGFTY